MSKAIDGIVEKIEDEQMKILYKEFNDVIEIVSKFIIRKKLILYGGLVINLALPRKYRFYKEFTINDYDCFSKTPLKDSRELALEIKKHKYKYIKIKKAKHDGTLKIYVYGRQIFDITMMPSNKYNKLAKYISKKENKLKYYKDKYCVIPFEYIKQNLHFELARPNQSGWRWQKIYTRNNLFNKFYKTEKSKLLYKCICIDNEYKQIVKNVISYVKNYKLPIIDNYPLKIYTNTSTCCYRLSNYSRYITILSMNNIKTKNEIVKVINNFLNKKTHDLSSKYYKINDYYQYNYCDLIITNRATKKTFNLIRIINIVDECFSINTYNGYTTGSIDTTMYFLHNDYIRNKIYLNNQVEAEENLYYINQYENYINKNIKNDVNKRLKSTCFGKINLENDIKRAWKNKFTLEYFS